METFVASATQAQRQNDYQLVLRHALDMGGLKDILAPTERSEDVGGGVKRVKRFTADIPIILMGGYSARSSAGHVAVHGADGGDEARCGYRNVLVVGGLGPNFNKKGGLRVFGIPIEGILIRGPVKIEEVVVAGNSNRASAEAALTGVKLLSNIDRKSVFLVEGQSDQTYVVRLRSTSAEGRTVFPAEHRKEMFSQENVVRRMLLSSAYRDLVRGKGDDSNPPSNEEVVAEAKRRMGAYLLAEAANEGRYWEILGRGFGSLMDSSDAAIEKMAEELGVVRKEE